LYKQQFERVKKVYPSYLFWGEEFYYIQKYTKMLLDKLQATPLRYYYEEYDFNSISQTLKHSSLFGDKNLVILRSEKPIPKKELQTLLELAGRSSNHLIYQLPSNEGKKIASLFKEPLGIEVRFFPPNFYEAKEELQEYINLKQIKIEPKALDHLLYLVENDLSKAIRELEKVSFEKITLERVQKEVYPLNPLNLDNFYLQLLKKVPLSKLLDGVFEQESSAIRILLGLETFIKKLFLFSTHQKLYNKVSSVEVLGYKLPPLLERELLALSRKIQNYSSIFSLLQECEFQLKKGNFFDPQALLIAYLIKLQELI